MRTRANVYTTLGRLRIDRILSTYKMWFVVISVPSPSARHARIIFFVFQAEDGIRDLAVTGVQTCALPICRRGHYRGWENLARRLVSDFQYNTRTMTHLPEYQKLWKRLREWPEFRRIASVTYPEGKPEIGRASCRE